jgi:subtilisin family serine protease
MNHFSVKWIKICVNIVTFFFLIGSTNIFAQHHTEISNSKVEQVRIERPENGLSLLTMENGKIVSANKEDPQEVVRIIVTFKDQPLAAYHVNKQALQKISIASVYSSLQASHFSFMTALNTISQQLSNKFKSGYSYTVTRDYYRALNGVAIQCKRRMVESIRSLPIVKYVSIDREVKADLTQSVHQIRADIVQDSLGITGKGVLVGDIDTGIDYNNPALGGGFGPAFRVIGGYNFVKNDNNPMDDHGHGTHVAGIIGANGDTLRGVAPDVKFLAVKVLDANGSGLFSDVIAGIDYCLDPDGNPQTDDAADVINMSLGGTPSPDNPVDSAVANATKAGVLCVVAAGNSGYGRYGTIGTPGTSESALTVGACDSSFNIAYFSSMGPDPIHSAIKPEVVAPGVNILSTILNNQTASWSGTSMATPHVTGTAALLKQEHPAWTPEEIKAAIVNTAHSTGDTVSIFAQGKGSVDALDAAEARLLVAPGVVSFGYDDLEKDVWIDTVKMIIGNFRSAAQNIRIGIVDEPPSGAKLTFDKTSFSLDTGQETTILAILSVPSSVPVLSTEPFAYIGKIKVTSDSDVVTVPFCFIKSTTLVITFDLPPVVLNLVDRTHGTINIESFGQDRTKYIIPVSEGYSLDMLALIFQDTLGSSNTYLVHHVIDNPTGLTYVLVNHNEATINMVGDTLYDIHNNRVTFDSTAYADVSYELVVYNKSFTYRSSLKFSAILSPYWNDSTRVRLFFSPLDSAFFIKKTFSASRDSDNFVLSRSLFGLHTQRDIDVATGAENLVDFHLTTSYDDPYLPIPSHWRKSIPVDLNTMRVYPGKFGYELESIRLDFPSYYLNQKPLSPNCNFYFNKPGIDEAKNDKYLYNSMDIGASFLHLHYTPDAYIFIDPPTLRTPDFTINDKGEAVFEQMRVTPLPAGSPMAAELSSVYTYETVKPGETIKIEQNSHLTYPDYMSYLTNGSLYMGCNSDWLNWELAVVYINTNGGIKQSNAVSECRDNYNLYWGISLFKPQVLANNKIKTNVKQFRPMVSPIPFPTAAPTYYIFTKINNDIRTLNLLSDAPVYSILGQAGQSTADFEYQVPISPADTSGFPSFNLLQVAVNGRAVDVVQPNQNGKIRLVLFDPNKSITSAKISLVLASGDEIDLPVSYVGGNEYDASVPNYIPKGFIDVVARAEDAQGNKCELNASPGFYFGNTSDNIKLDARLRMTSYALNNVDSVNFNIGDTLNYTLSYTNFGSDIARNLVITFPTTQYFKPIGSTSWTIDSLAVNDTVHLPVSLVFIGKQQSTDKYTHYSPSLTWTSGGTNYLRNSKILVDFQNNVTGIAETNNAIPNKFELYQNYPNPFNPSTTIKYDLAKETRVKLVVYDILGREVATLVNETEKAGSYHVIWDASRLASGVYFYRIQAKDYSAVKKLLLLK